MMGVGITAGSVFLSFERVTVLHCCGFSHVFVPKDLRKPLK